MTTNPVFSTIRARIAQAQRTIVCMGINDVQQRALSFSRPELYSQDIHAQSMAFNILSAMNSLEGILRSLVTEVDGLSPNEAIKPQELLMHASLPDEGRALIIEPGVADRLEKLFIFREALKDTRAHALPAFEVLSTVSLLQSIAPNFFADVVQFMHDFERGEAPSAKFSYRP